MPIQSLLVMGTIREYSPLTCCGSLASRLKCKTESLNLVFVCLARDFSLRGGPVGLDQCARMSDIDACPPRWCVGGKRTTRTTFGKFIPTEGPTFPGWPESPNGSCSSTPDSATLPATPSVAIRRGSLQHGSRKRKLPRPA